ncbi:hypothetical protein AAF712_016781, partial [Marasmius tenuissimus]
GQESGLDTDNGGWDIFLSQTKDGGWEESMTGGDKLLHDARASRGIATVDMDIIWMPILGGSFGSRDVVMKDRNLQDQQVDVIDTSSSLSQA